MAIVACYILREKTRPSNEEAGDFIFSCLAAKDKSLLGELITQSTGNLPISTANLTMKGDVYDMTDSFIRSCDGGKYLDNKRNYEILFFRANTGKPPEPTSIVVVRSRETPLVDDDVTDAVKRGRRWEELGLFSDALICYKIALNAHAGEPELLHRYGCVCMAFPSRWGDAYQSLLKAVTLEPQNMDYAVSLADCYVLLADKGKVGNATPEQLLNMAADLLGRAAKMIPSDKGIQKKYADLNNRLGNNREQDFFS